MNRTLLHLLRSGTRGRLVKHYARNPELFRPNRHLVGHKLDIERARRKFRDVNCRDRHCDDWALLTSRPNRHSSRSTPCTRVFHNLWRVGNCERCLWGLL